MICCRKNGYVQIFLTVGAIISVIAVLGAGSVLMLVNLISMIGCRINGYIKVFSAVGAIESVVTVLGTGCVLMLGNGVAVCNLLKNFVFKGFITVRTVFAVITVLFAGRLNSDFFNLMFFLFNNKGFCNTAALCAVINSLALFRTG